LSQAFQVLVAKYSDRPGLAERLWKELELTYSASERFYHNLDHLRHLFAELEVVKAKIKNWDAQLFALFYHDAVYIPTNATNEEDSAGLARKRLREIGVMPYTIDQCVDIILATKNHSAQDNEEINYFLDADLSILGTDWPAYYNYSLSIREEYAVYPDNVYIPGRIKVLEHFLDMTAIFKTDFFTQRYEFKAMENLNRELRLLKQP